MSDYCKRADTEHVSLGFRHTNPVNFNIKTRPCRVEREPVQRQGNPRYMGTSFLIHGNMSDLPGVGSHY